MKFMNWSYSELMSTPDDLVRRVIRLINEIQEQAELDRLLNL